jgi:hypothetical protein
MMETLKESRLACPKGKANLVSASAQVLWKLYLRGEDRGDRTLRSGPSLVFFFDAPFVENS